MMDLLPKNMNAIPRENCDFWIAFAVALDHSWEKESLLPSSIWPQMTCIAWASQNPASGFLLLIAIPGPWTAISEGASVKNPNSILTKWEWSFMDRGPVWGAAPLLLCMLNLAAWETGCAVILMYCHKRILWKDMFSPSQKYNWKIINEKSREERTISVKSSESWWNEKNIKFRFANASKWVLTTETLLLPASVSI